MNGANFKELETRGFLVIPSFLSQDEVKGFREDFRRQGFDETNANCSLGMMSSRANGQLKGRVLEVLRHVVESTDLLIDCPETAWYFPTGKGRGINFPWHQDHENFYQVQNSYDYLNFYIPITKPRLDKSNVGIIPFDVLQREDPKLHGRMLRRGATHFDWLGNTHLVYFDDGGEIHIVGGDMERMAYTPQLAEGDLLLLRGDTIHRTEDSETERVAISFRAISAKTPVKRATLAKGGYVKARMMVNHPEPYQRMFKAFDQAGRDEMTALEMRELMDAVTVQPPKSRQEFFWQLVREKRRARVLGHYLWSSLGTFSVATARRVITSGEGPIRRIRKALGLEVLGEADGKPVHNGDSPSGSFN